MDLSTNIVALRQKLATLAGTVTVEAVDFPAVAGLHVRVISGAERDAAFADKDDTHRYAKLLTRAICDADGNRIYQDNEFLAVHALPSPLFDALMKSAAKINNLLKESVASAEKNSSTTGTSSSGSASSSTSAAAPSGNSNPG